jgi:DNA-binding NarL/FixJ family response regulator
MDHPLNVLLCHETPLIGAGIAAMLHGHADITVTPCEGDVASAWHSGNFDVVVADYTSGLQCAAGPGCSGPGRPPPRPRVLIVTAKGSEWEIRHAIACGVQGYLLQDCAGQTLAHAVRSVARGARCFDAAVSSRMADSLVRATLTLREHEVLQLLARGCCNKTIAQRLDIAVGTVKAHIKSILEKLNVKTRLQAAALAEERGMLRVPPRPPPAARRAPPRLTHLPHAGQMSRAVAAAP